MRFIILIFSTLMSVAVFSQEFQIVEATSQKWAGGRKESGQGINYQLKIITKKSSDKLSFEKLWVDTSFYILKTRNLKNKAKDNSFAKNDTIGIFARKIVSKEMNPGLEDEMDLDNNHNLTYEQAPYQFKGAALIGYKYKGKWKYKVIDVFKELEKLNYP